MEKLPSNMFDKLEKIWKIKDVRNRVLFVVAMLTIFRLTAHIPMPGVDAEALKNVLSGNQILGLLNLFSGGTIENFSIVMLGVAPYITASIIFQLLVMVVPQLEELSKEGESGQQKINMYTRLSTIPLALLQAFSLIKLLQGTQGILGSNSTLQFVFMLLSVTAGTVFLMWIGELITEKNVGNGISLLIFAAIVSALPTTTQNLIVNYNPADLYTYILFLVIAVITIVGVIFVTEGQRNIPISYAKARGVRGQGSNSHLPLRVNMAGVIPIIFAVSLVLFPPMIAQFFINRPDVIGSIAKVVSTAFSNQIIYALIYFLLVFGFTYFYTAIIFKPDKIAENLQRQGGFIPGIRPGKQTEQYLSKIMGRLVFTGATFLSAIAVMPVIVQMVSGIQSLAIGGMSMLIVVSVAIEVAKQIDAQIMMHEYDRV